ncbi:hypothetical protein BV20DRAFT_424095 [Pilatotrama ljubarskyi]|nr:hypothetical protein BV20DRAFT_424095 [Pilatotrama ljubarskyi]
MGSRRALPDIPRCNSLGKVQRLFSFRRRVQRRRKVGELRLFEKRNTRPARFLCIFPRRILAIARRGWSRSLVCFTTEPAVYKASS